MRMTTGRKKGIIFGKGIGLFPLPAQEQEDQEKIFNSRMAEADRKGMEKGMKKGIEKGIKEGIEKGKKEEKIEIAKNALNDGINIETISKITGLSIEEIEKLQ